jgi:hypothetical protein
VTLAVIRRLASADFYRDFAGQEVLHEAEFLVEQFLQV